MTGQWREPAQPQVKPGPIGTPTNTLDTHPQILLPWLFIAEIDFLLPGINLHDMVSLFLTLHRIKNRTSNLFFLSSTLKKDKTSAERTLGKELAQRQLSEKDAHTGFIQIKTGQCKIAEYRLWSQTGEFEGWSAPSNLWPGLCSPSFHLSPLLLRNSSHEP